MDLWSHTPSIFRTAVPDATKSKRRFFTFTEVQFDNGMVEYEISNGGFSRLEVIGIAEQIKVFSMEDSNGR